MSSSMTYMMPLMHPKGYICGSENTKNQNTLGRTISHIIKSANIVGHFTNHSL